MARLEVTEVTKAYPTRSEPVVVLRGITFALDAGESLAIVGPSGSGKTTLLSIIGTLEPPTHGTVRFDGQDPFAFDERALAAFRNHRIGFVFQDHHLLPQCSALENVLLPTIAEGPASAEAHERAGWLLERVQLGHRLAHRPSELSGGERQRVALARALVQNPQLVLADEPTGNLDPSTAAAVGQLLTELQTDEDWILITVTHSMELARRFARRATLDNGLLVPAQP